MLCLTMLIFHGVCPVSTMLTPAGHLSTLLEKDIVQQSFVCLRRIIILVCNYSKMCP